MSRLLRILLQDKEVGEQFLQLEGTNAPASFSKQQPGRAAITASGRPEGGVIAVDDTDDDDNDNEDVLIEEIEAETATTTTASSNKSKSPKKKHTAAAAAANTSMTPAAGGSKQVQAGAAGAGTSELEVKVERLVQSMVAKGAAREGAVTKAYEIVARIHSMDVSEQRGRLERFETRLQHMKDMQELWSKACHANNTMFQESQQEFTSTINQFSESLKQQTTHLKVVSLG